MYNVRRQTEPPTLENRKDLAPAEAFAADTAKVESIVDADRSSTDGSVSLQDACDTSGTTTASRVLAQSSATPGSAAPSEDAKHDSAQNQTQVGAARRLITDSKGNLKDITPEELLNEVKQIVCELEKLEDCLTKEWSKYQEKLGSFYWEYHSHREEIADCVSDTGYAAVTMKMLETVDSVDICKDDDIWNSIYYSYFVIQNLSDASRKMGKSLAEAGAVRVMTLKLGHKPFLDAMEDERVYRVMKASLGVLHNISWCPDVRHFFKENKTAEVILPFITMEDENLKANATMTLAYIVEEEENSKLIDNTGIIEQIVRWTEKAVENTGMGRYRGFAPWELVEVLDKLAVNDVNKMKVIEAGALPVFLNMLQHDDPREQAVTASCIWTLTFDKTVQEKIKGFEGLMPALETLAKSENPQVKKAANEPKGAKQIKGHIMISYCWNEKETARTIGEWLKQAGYRVWIDYEQMGGSTLQAMAEAVENAVVVLVCMSEKYKESPNCRTEAEYTYALHKRYIPLLLQREYKPDGWLGALKRSLLYYDFSVPAHFEEKFQELLKALGDQGKVSGSDHLDVVDVGPVTPSRPAQSMSTDDVARWLVDHKLDVCVPLMAQLDGKPLLQLKQMKDEKPHFVFNLLKTELKLSFFDILRFMAALDEL